MLQRIRDNLEKQKWLQYTVLGTLSIIFAAWGAYGIVNLSDGESTYAAEAGGQKVTVDEARREWTRRQVQWQQSTGTEIPAGQKELMQDQLLEDMINRLILSERAHDLGYRVGREEVLNELRNIPQFQIGGVYNPQIARDALASQGLTDETFEAQLRDSLLRQQLLNSIGVSDFVTPHEMLRIRALQNEQREVRFATLAPEKFEADTAVDDATVQAYYKAHAGSYMTLEAAHIQYAELRLDAVAAQMEVTDSDLHASYDKQKDRFLQPEKRRAQQILITVDKDDAAALKQAQQVFAEAKSGKDFGQLVKQYSKDVGAAESDGVLDWFVKSTYEGPLGDALWSMAPGEIRGPIKSQYGYHIVKLLEVQPPKGKTFEEARPEIEADLKRTHATDRFGEIQEQLQSKLGQSDANLDALAKEFNLQTGDIPDFVRGAGTAPLAGAQPIQDLVFGESPLAVGKAGGPVVVGEDRLVIVKVLDHRLPQPKPIAEVHDAIVAQLRKEHGTEAALKAAEEARNKLESGAAFDDVVKGLGVTSDPAKFVGRTDPSVPTPIRTLAFGSPKPTGKPVYRAVQLPTGGAAVLALTAVRSQEPTSEQDKQAQLVAEKQASVRDGSGEIAAYVAELRRTSDVKKNIKALE